MHVNIGAELGAIHRRDLLAQAEQGRLARLARTGPSSEEQGIVGVGGVAVPSWRLWLGGSLVRWGVALSGDALPAGMAGLDECGCCP